MMSLKDFWDLASNANIEFGDLMVTYADKDSRTEIPDDHWIWEYFGDLDSDHPEEINYYGCFVDYGTLYVYVDINNIEALIEKYCQD